MKMMKTYLVLAAFLAIACISCNTTEVDLPSKSDFKNFSEEPYIIGKITNISTRYIGEESYLTVLVEENTDVHEPLETGGKKISFFLGEMTEIFLQKRDGDLYPYDKEMLKVDQKVGGWTTGVVMDSYPLQGGAKRIVVIEK